LAAGEAQILERQPVDREDAAGGAVLGRHVADGGAIGDRQMVETLAEELDELADHALAPQHLGDGEHEIGRRGALGQLADEAKAHDLGDDHGDRLAEHGRLGLDAADAPAQHREAVHHGGVAVGADQRVGIGDLPVALGRGPDHLGQVLEVDLMADARAGRDHAEVVERLAAPAQEGVALAVALVLALDVDLEGARVAEGVDLDRVVDDEVDLGERVDLIGIAAEVEHGLAHGGEVDHRRHAGEVLHQHARRPVGDLLVGAPLIEPLHQRLQVIDGDAACVLETQQILEQHLERIGQARDVAELGRRLLEREDVVARIAHLDLPADAEAVVAECGHDALPRGTTRSTWLRRWRRRTGGGCGSDARSVPRGCARYGRR
jgi:hypothetical protein